MTRKSTLSPESAAIIEHLKVHGTSSLAGLLIAFAHLGRTPLLKRLGNLVALGWLETTTVCAGVKGWTLRASARSAAATVSPRQATADSQDMRAQPARQGDFAEPRRISFKEGTYTPGPGPALRPGALDHQRFASVGSRC